jgi:hypothetical protein
MIKKLIIILIIIFAFLATSIYIFQSNIKRYAIQTILKSFPMPNIALANVSFDETTGRLNLEEIKVKNPKGFKSKYILEADSIDMDISFTTKPNLCININELNVSNPIIYIEHSPIDTWNFLEYTRKSKKVSFRKEVDPDFIKDAFADEIEKNSEVLLPRTINIDNGTVHFLDNFITFGKTHKIDFYPITGTFLLQYVPEKQNYRKISFNGSCSIVGNLGSMIKGGIEIHPMKKRPSYIWKFNAYNIPLPVIKPYFDRYTPFIVRQGSFNMVSDVKALDGVIDGDYTMELMDLEFAVNPEKSNIPFLETSVKKLTLYLTNQRGNVIIDFKQKGKVGGKIHWELGPIAKRAIGLMAIDTVLEVIDAIEKGRKGEVIKEGLPGDIPPDVIDIFRGIFR